MVNGPSVELIDVTLRDGLQMEARVLSTDEKVALFRRVLSYRPGRVELTSFVHPKWIPQFADAEALLTALKPELSKTQSMAFVPNLKGLERLLKFPVPWVSAFVAVSETFNAKNVNQPIDATLEELGRVVRAAHQAGLKARLYVSTLFGCPYEGDVPAPQIAKVLEKVAALGPDEIALSDTLGTATLPRVNAILDTSLKWFPAEKTALHVHNTYGKALMAIEVAYARGVRKFDASLGGIGGCPYAKGASGNVPLEDVAWHFQRSHLATGIAFTELRAAVSSLSPEFKIKPRSHLAEIYSLGGTPYGLS